MSASLDDHLLPGSLKGWLISREECGLPIRSRLVRVEPRAIRNRCLGRRAPSQATPEAGKRTRTEGAVQHVAESATRPGRHAVSAPDVEGEGQFSLPGGEFRVGSHVKKGGGCGFRVESSRVIVCYGGFGGQAESRTAACGRSHIRARARAGLGAGGIMRGDVGQVRQDADFPFLDSLASRFLQCPVPFSCVPAFLIPPFWIHGFQISPKCGSQIWKPRSQEGETGGSLG